MKSALISGIGVLVGFTFAYFGEVRFIPLHIAQEPTRISANGDGALNFQAQLDSARAISREAAYLMFYAYHQSTNPVESKGLLKKAKVQNQISINEPISYFFLDIEKTLNGIAEKAGQEGKNLIGLAAIPGYDQATDAHTLIWLGVTEEIGEDSLVERKLFFPQNPNTVDYIFNHGAVCPDACATNSDRLWEVNWSN